MPSGTLSLYAIWQWGQEQDAATVKAMGFTQEKAAAVPSIHGVFTGLDVAAFGCATAAWMQR